MASQNYDNNNRDYRGYNTEYHEDSRNRSAAALSNVYGLGSRSQHGGCSYARNLDMVIALSVFFTLTGGLFLITFLPFKEMSLVKV